MQIQDFHIYNIARPYLLPVQGHDTKCVGTEIRPQHLQKLHCLAGNITAMELRDGGGPDHLWQQGEEGSGGVSHAEVEEEEVHSRDLCVLGEDDHDDEEVA